MIPDYWERSIGAHVPGFGLDLRWMGLPPDLDEQLAGPLVRAWSDLEALEAGAIVNRDESRRVGHYWLRAPERAPTDAAREIAAARVELDRVVESLGGRFPRVLLIGIGGSALGPELVARALETVGGRRRLFILDNTDPDGMARVLRACAPLSSTLVVVISKSGATAETRNGMLITKAAYEAAGLVFGEHAIAVTQTGSALDLAAKDWIARLPMWDWVGGRTSVTSIVGLLPAALVGIDIDDLLAGARAMDEHTRVPLAAENPAALLALAWYHAGGGKGDRQMVILPYKDRLALMSRYLQQLVMESIGKRVDRHGRLVYQGLTVYGNKGSTDQHAFVQQLRDGRADVFATFIEVLEDGEPHAQASAIEVEPGVTAGDFLSGFLAGTRDALAEAGRPSVTITLPWLDAASMGALIALYERAVSIYASLLDVNAYDQPGVEAGKKAAAKMIGLQTKLLALLARGECGTASALAAQMGAAERDVFHVLRHLGANARVSVEGAGLERVFRARTH